MFQHPFESPDPLPNSWVEYMANRRRVRRRWALYGFVWSFTVIAGIILWSYL